jgi:hypothetical protein
MAIEAMEFGLGRFGDRRLEKGGRLFMRRWSNGRAPAFGGWPADGRRRCGSRAYCAMVL